MKARKLISTLLSIAMIVSALCISAAAAPATIEPDYLPEYWIGDLPTNTVSSRSSESAQCTMSYNPGSGTTGSTIFAFTAESSSLSFTISWNGAGGHDTYAYRLWRVNGSGGPDSSIGTEHIGSFDVLHGYEGLVVGASYYLKASSLNVPKEGVTCTYSFTN